MKILTIVGARPQFVKAAMVSRALRKIRGVRERILHTGQHFDFKMSALFFRQMGIPAPYRNLNAHGSGLHAAHTAAMLPGIERECVREKPDWVVVYGDTTSTLAGALVASKLCIPLAHVEAGLRSFNRRMPEEINRIVADRLSQLLFVPTQTAVTNLRREGITHGVARVGDVMIDAIHFFRDRARRMHSRFQLPKEKFFVLTLHRQENTDHPARLRAILRALSRSPIPFLFPAHPRTWKVLARRGIALPKNIRMIEPVGYLEMILLQDASEGVWTDSGGMQKEAVVLGKRCFTLREETEWVETVRSGWNRLVGADPKRIQAALKRAMKRPPRRSFPTARFYGDGRAAQRIAAILTRG